MSEVMTFNEFLNEELENTNTEELENTINVYNKYKGRIKTFIDKENIDASREKFEDFLSKLKDNEKSASDLLRTNYSAEIIRYKIDDLENSKKEIDLQIKTRMEELKELQSKIK